MGQHILPLFVIVAGGLIRCREGLPEKVKCTPRPSRISGSSPGKGGRKEQQMGGRRRNMSPTRQTGRQEPGHAGLVSSRRDDTHLTGPLAGLNEIIYAKLLVLCLHTVNIQQMGASLIKCKYTRRGWSLLSRTWESLSMREWCRRGKKGLQRPTRMPSL